MGFKLKDLFVPAKVVNFVGKAVNKTLGSKPVQSIAGTVGGLFNTLTGQSQANQWQWDMWNAQNAYNTPAAQRERLEAAGYNPMLLNSGGSAVAGNAGSMSSKSGSGVSPFEILNAVVNARVGLSNADLLAEQARKLRHDTDLIDGTPISSNDRSFMSGLGRLFNWMLPSDVKSSAADYFKKKSENLFGSSIPKTAKRVQQDTRRSGRSNKSEDRLTRWLKKIGFKIPDL